MTAIPPRQPLRQCPNPFAKLQANDGSADELNRVQDNVKAAFDASTACTFQLVSEAFSRATSTSTTGLVRVANLAALRALDTTSWRASDRYALAEVDTNGRIYVYLSNSTATPVLNDVVLPDAGPGRWHDSGNTTSQWWEQSFWAVDPANSSGNASDENKGYGATRRLAANAPLLNYAELWRRIKGAHFGTRIVQVLMMSDSAFPIAIPSTFTFENSDGADVNFGGYLCLIVGNAGATPDDFEVIHTGTLTAGTTLAAGQHGQIIEDTALAAGGWAVTGTGGSISSPTGGTRLIRTPDGLNYAFVSMQETASPKKAHTWTPVQITREPGSQIGTAISTAFVPGAAYEIVRCRTLPGLTMGPSIPVHLIGIDARDQSVTPFLAQVVTGSESISWVLGGCYKASVFGTLRGFCFGTYATSVVCAGGYTTQTGCGILGDSSGGGPGNPEFWETTFFTPLAKFTLTRVTWKFFGGVIFSGEGSFDFHFDECLGFCIELRNGPMRFLFDTLSGSSSLGQDRMFSILGTDCRLVCRGTDIATALTNFNLYGGALGVVGANKYQFYGTTPANGYSGEFNDIDRRISLESFAAFV